MAASVATTEFVVRIASAPRAAITPKGLEWWPAWRKDRRPQLRRYTLGNSGRSKMDLFGGTSEV